MLCQLLIECGLLLWHADCLSTPKIGFLCASDSRKIEFNTMASRLSWRIFLNHKHWIHVQIICGVHDLVNHWLDNELNVCQVWMIFEHTDACLHGSLHRRD